MDKYNIQARNTMIVFLILTLIIVLLTFGVCVKSCVTNNSTSNTESYTYDDSDIFDNEIIEDVSVDEFIEDTSFESSHEEESENFIEITLPAIDLETDEFVEDNYDLEDSVSETTVEVESVESKETRTESDNSKSDDETTGKLYTDEDAIMIAKLLYKECRGNPSTMQKAAVAWVVLNRLDYPDKHYGKTIKEVITNKRNFKSYRENTEVRDSLLEIAYDVLERWEREKNGEEDVGRVLPIEYRYFYAKPGTKNLFVSDWGDKEHTQWDWSLPNPYDS